MNTEQLLLNKWRVLPTSQQQEVIDFVEFLESRLPANSEKTASKPQADLGNKLRKIREEIILSGISLLDAEEVEKEKAERQGILQED